MEESIRSAISAFEIFLVFYQDRGVSIPSYYLDSGYVYSSGNAQIQQFPFNNATYDAEYPVSWNSDKAFSYLRKEIN
jgi:hypothetical protein